MVELTYLPFGARYAETRTGESVPKSDVVKEKDRIIERAKIALGLIALRYTEGKISLEEMQTQMAEELKFAHIQASSLGAGGTLRMSVEHYRDINERIENEFIGFLFGFGIAISAGGLSDKAIVARAQAYARSIARSFSGSEKITRIRDGANEARRWLDPAAKHCFIAGTKVMTQEGNKSIEEITKQDKVLTRDSYKQVKENYAVPYNGDLYTIRVNEKEVTCTYNHPFFTKNRGWVQAKDLTEDDELLLLEQDS